MSDKLEMQRIFEAAKKAAKTLAHADSGQKDRALAQIAKTLEENAAQIAAANQLDIAAALAKSLPESLVDRLLLDAQRVHALAQAVRAVIALKDPVGEVLRGSTLTNGLLLQQVRVPLGVIGAIYEARPNVTVDIVALALKSGNGVILRGGSAAENTNAVLVELLQKAISEAGLDGQAVQTVDAFGRQGAQAMMQARGFIDVLIPRGSQDLINTVVANATVPVIETGAGVVHIYVDKSADQKRALEIIANAKVQRPGVCNAVDTVIVHEQIASAFLPQLAEYLGDKGVTLLVDQAAKHHLPEALLADAQTFYTEHLSLNLGVKVVQSLDAALAHIAEHSTGHTEAVLAEDVSVVERFLREVDAASVIANASTRFTDGAAFGFGAEVGISTQKLHARGPMALPEMTSTKWITRGNGQIRV